MVDRFGEKLFGITPSSPRSVAVLDASFSRRYLAISEPGSDVRIFELPSGREVARHVQPKNHHVLWLSAFSGGSLFHGVQWHYQTGGPRRLFRFRADPSDPELISDLGECAEAGFCRRGRQLLTWEGDLIDCRSGRTIRKLDFPQTEYPIDTTNESDLQLGGLKGLTRLRSLNLSEMRVTDAELENLKGLTALQSLDLSENPRDGCRTGTPQRVDRTPIAGPVGDQGHQHGSKRTPEGSATLFDPVWRGVADGRMH